MLFQQLDITKWWEKHLFIYFFSEMHGKLSIGQLFYETHLILDHCCLNVMQLSSVVLRKPTSSPPIPYLPQLSCQFGFAHSGLLSDTLPGCFRSHRPSINSFPLPGKIFSRSCVTGFFSWFIFHASSAEISSLTTLYSRVWRHSLVPFSDFLHSTYDYWKLTQQFTHSLYLHLGCPFHWAVTLSFSFIFNPHCQEQDLAHGRCP